MMGKKAKNSLIGFLIIISGFAYLFEKIGWGWFWAILGILAVGFVIKSFDDGLPKYPMDEFGPLFPSPQEASKYYQQLMKKNPKKAARLREQQIMRESLDIGLSSKKKDTAESRMDLARQKFHKLRINYHIPQKEWGGIEQRYKDALKKYSTICYINEAQGYLDKIQKLKSDRAKKKYADLARQVLSDGLQNPKSDKNKLQLIFDSIPSF